LRVAKNAIKHGLTGTQAVLPHEDPEEFEDFRKALWIQLAPQGPLEAVLVEKMNIDLWRLRRVPLLENAMYTAGERENELTGIELMRKLGREAAECLELERAEASAAPDSGERPANAETPTDAASEREKRPAELFDPRSMVWRLRGNPGFANLWRHESDLQKSFYRALHELQRLPAMRAGERVPVPAAVDVDVTMNRNGAVNPE
jgi:hypothetical protein